MVPNTSLERDNGVPESQMRLPDFQDETDAGPELSCGREDVGSEAWDNQHAQVHCSESAIAVVAENEADDAARRGNLFRCR